VQSVHLAILLFVAPISISMNTPSSQLSESDCNGLTLCKILLDTVPSHVREIFLSEWFNKTSVVWRSDKSLCAHRLVYGDFTDPITVFSVNQIELPFPLSTSGVSFIELYCNSTSGQYWKINDIKYNHITNTTDLIAQINNANLKYMDTSYEYRDVIVNISIPIGNFLLNNSRNATDADTNQLSFIAKNGFIKFCGKIMLTVSNQNSNENCYSV
jgi:hypothetical protein